MPISIPIIVSGAIGRVGEPVDMLIMQVGVVPIGVVIADRRGVCRAERLIDALTRACWVAGSSLVKPGHGGRW